MKMWHLFVGAVGCLLLWTFPKTNGLIRPPVDSGCSPIIKNYGCYCPKSLRKIPSKCKTLFDEELMDSKNGFPNPLPITHPDPNPYLSTIDMTVGNICHIDKYCEIKVSPSNPDWKIIDWCITTQSPAAHHLQLLGPPHSPVCCDSKNDKKYTMMCMRRDMNLQRFLESPLIISLHLRLLPREAIEFKLSLVLLSSSSVQNVIPAEFSDKKNSGGALLKLITVDNLVLDLSQIKKWEDL